MMYKIYYVYYLEYYVAPNVYKSLGREAQTPCRGMFLGAASFNYIIGYKMTLVQPNYPVNSDNKDKRKKKKNILCR